VQIWWAFDVWTRDGAECQILSAGVDAVANNENAPEKQASINPMNGHCYSSEYTGIAPRVTVGLLFLSLALVQGLYGYHLAHMPPMRFRQIFRLAENLLTKINTFLCISFCIRGLYALGTLLGMHALPAIPLQDGEDVKWNVALSFLLWEYLPTLLLVFSFAQPFGGTYAQSGTHNDQSARSGRRHEYSDLENIVDEDDDSVHLPVNMYREGYVHTFDHDHSGEMSHSHHGNQSKTSGRRGSQKRARSGDKDEGGDGDGDGDGDGGWCGGWLDYRTPPFLHSPDSHRTRGTRERARERADSVSDADNSQTKSRHMRGLSRGITGPGSQLAGMYGSVGPRVGSGASCVDSLEENQPYSVTSLHPQPQVGTGSDSNAAASGGKGVSPVRQRDGEKIHAGSLERFSTPSSLEPQTSWLSSFPAISSSTAAYAPTNMNVPQRLLSGNRVLTINTHPGQMTGEGQALLALGVTPPAHMAGTMFGRDGSSNSNASVYSHVGVGSYETSEQAASSSGSYPAISSSSEALMLTQTDRQNLTIDRQIRRLRGNSVEIQALNIHAPARIRGNSFHSPPGMVLPTHFPRDSSTGNGSAKISKYVETKIKGCVKGKEEKEKEKETNAREREREKDVPVIKNL